MADEPVKKKPTKITASRQGATRLNMMVRDLRKMKAELLPDEPESQDGVELKNMDDFQRQKALLTKKLGALHQVRQAACRPWAQRRCHLQCIDHTSTVSACGDHVDCSCSCVHLGLYAVFCVPAAVDHRVE